MSFIKEIILTVMLYCVLQLAIPPLIHSRMMNKWAMIPAMALAGLAAAALIVYLEFPPLLLGIAMFGTTYHTLKVMTEKPFQVQHITNCGEPPKMPLYRISSYLYVGIACIGGQLLQTQSVDQSGQITLLWKTMLGIQQN